MNSVEIKRSSTKDRYAGQLVVDYYSAKDGSLYKSGPGRFVSTVVKSTGANPSYAIAGVPMREIMGPGKWDQLPGVALRNDAFAGQVRLLSRASVGYLENNQKMTLLNGWVIYHAHTINPGEDSVVTAIFDDRHIMASYFTLFGKMYFDPSTGRHYFVDNNNDPLVFNKNGHGDCIDTPYGPRFAPGHRYGHLATDEADASSEPAPGYATSKTRKWAVKDILIYIRDFFYNIVRRPALGGDYGLLELPKNYIKWPEGFGSNIVENKTPRSWNLDGTNCLDAICRTLAYAGPYELSLEPVNDQQSEMKVVKFDIKKNQGSNIYHPEYFGDLDQAMWNSSVAQRVNIKESSAGWCDNVRNLGDAPSVEFMPSTKSGDPDAWGTYLVPGWTQAEEDAFKALVSSASLGGEKDTQNAFTLACRKYPSVFCWYRVAGNKNPFTGTKWANKGYGGNWRIKPHLLTPYNANANSPLGLVPMEVIVEYELYTIGAYVEAPTTDPDSMGRWRWADRYNELQLSPCGTFVQLPAARDRLKTWYTYHDDGASGNDAGQYQGSYMFKRDIRINLVVEQDHSLVAAATGDPNKSAGRIDQGVPKFTFLVRNQPMQYVDHLRNSQAYPIGIGGIPAALRNQLTGRFQPKRTAGNELFTDHIGNGDTTDTRNRLQSHADKYLSNYKRIAYEGDFLIAMLAPVWAPGMQVSYERRNVISNVFGIIKCVVFDANAQTTRIEFGPPSYSTIWDGPLQALTNSSNNGGAPYVPSEGGKGDGYKDTGKTTGGDSPDQPKTRADDYDRPGAPGGPERGASSDNDSEANNQAIRNNSSASSDAPSSGGSGGGGGNAGAAESASGKGGGRDLEAEEMDAAQGPTRNRYSGTDYSRQEAAAAPAAAEKRSTIRTEADLAGDDALARGEGATDKGIYSGESLKGRDEERKVAMQATYRNSGNRDTPMARGLMAGERNAARSSKFNITGDVGIITSKARQAYNRR